MNKPLYLLVLFLVLSAGWAHAQSDLSKIIPPSPTAAALGKYGDIPVSTYTGIPSISIPLYEIKDKGVSVPISLSYHASGIRVEEEASWAGLGWSLIAGGVITRSVRGVDDLVSDGSAIGYPLAPLPTSIDANNNYIKPQGHPDWSYFQSVCAGAKDPEPDLFYFNFPGHSGKFVFQQNTIYTAPYTVQLISQEKIKVYYDGAQHWIITAEDGTKYYFGTTEKSQSSSIPFDPYHVYTPVFLNPRTIISSWYLDEIEGPNGEHIEFKYTTPSLNGSTPTLSVTDTRQRTTDVQLTSSTNCHTPDIDPMSHFYSATQNINYDVYLKEIDFPNGKIEFQTSTRTDIAPFTDNYTPLSSYPQKLDRMVVSRIEQGVATPVKTYELAYDYFTNPNVSDQYANSRLRLLSLAEKAADSAAKTPYLFDYTLLGTRTDDQIPAKDSWSRDHWGYFNNKPNTAITDNTSITGPVKTLIPALTYQTPTGSFVYINGANREADATYMKAGLLKKITYPTGGTTNFDFQPNDFATNDHVRISHREGVYAYGPQVLDPDLTLPSSRTFAIVNPHTLVKVSGSVYQAADTYCNNDENYTILSGTVRNSTTGATALLVSVPIGCSPTRGFEYFITLEPGTYTVEANTVNPDQETYIDVNWDEETTQPMYNQIGGGVRIARTTDYDGISHTNDVVKRYVYTGKVNGIQRSTGILMTVPVYVYMEDLAFHIVDINAYGYVGCDVTWKARIIHQSAQSNIPLGNSAQGSPVGYSEVSVLFGENGEYGKSVYDYLNAPEGVVPYLNIPTLVHQENGSLINATDYKKVPGSTGFQKVKEVTKTYIRENAQTTIVKGMKCYACEYAQLSDANDPTYPIIKFYDVSSEWWHPTSETVKMYDGDDETKFLQTYTEYFYDNPVHKQLTRTKQIQSDGATVITEYTYPADYTAVHSGVIAAMKGDDYHMHNRVIEKVTKKQKGTDVKVVDASFTAYGSPSGGVAPGVSIVPMEEYALEIRSPKPGFISSLSTGSPADGDYRLIRTIKYGGRTTPVEIQEKDNIKTSFIWGYDQYLPVAKALNAAPEDIAYTSFEPDDAGEWNMSAGSATNTNSNAVTGKNTFSGEVAKTMPTVGSYIVTLWSSPSGVVTVNGAAGTLLNANGRNGWQLYQWTLSNTSTVTISGTEIDEVRIYPPGAQMTTYTYDPLIGMTSQCDINNRVSYYKYDGLYRLTVIKDQDGNIIKTYKYHYKQ